MTADAVLSALDRLDDLTVALADVPRPGPWAAAGRCRTAPVEAFFPTRGDDTKAAKEICRLCPVIDQCRTYAVAAGASLAGVWGGTTARERRRLRVQTALAELQPDIRPRATQSPKGTLYATLEQLTAHPGRWARVAHYAARGSAQSTASLLRTGRIPVPPGRWQFEGRLNDDGGSDLHAVFEPAEEGVA